MGVKMWGGGWPLGEGKEGLKYRRKIIMSFMDGP